MFDIFIRRPVLSLVVSLLILLIGARALATLPVRQYPQLYNTVITITTVYPGADAELMQGFVTDPIQKAVATADGIDYLTSQSAANTSTVSVFVRLNENPDAAMTAVTAKVNETRSVLPRDVNDPIIQKSTGDSFAPLYIAFTSKTMSEAQVTDYLTRVVQPKLSIVPGVSSPQLLGGREFAMRIWLNPTKLAEFGLSAGDVANAIQANNYLSTAGSSKGVFDITGTTARTDARTVDDFKNLVIRNNGAEVIRMRDVAEVVLGPQNVASSVFVNGVKAVYIGVNVRPDANPLSVANEMYKVLPQLERELPQGLTMTLDYDTTIFIRAAIAEVIKTMVEAMIIVMVVIFAFMGSIRSVTIPLVTIPLSLIGVGIFLAAFGYSINLLTLLAMVLAIGLVVDDAIVVVENVHRHIERGLTPFNAALVGTREIAGPVISMTITLAAVYAPVAFMTGMTGALFKEFAVALAGAVIVSGIIALTLSPMMSSRILSPVDKPTRLQAKIDALFHWSQTIYLRLIRASLMDRTPTVLFAIIVSASLYFLYSSASTELAPDEDSGAVFFVFSGPTNANIDYMDQSLAPLNEKFRKVPGTDRYFAINGAMGTNAGFGVLSLKSWGERHLSQFKIAPLVQDEINSISAIKGTVFAPPSLPGADGMPIQFVITTTADYRTLNDVAAKLAKEANESGLFVYSDLDLKFEKPQTIVHIDRDKAASYGISMSDIANTLAILTGGNYVNRMNLYNRSYQVIPQVPRIERLKPEDLANYYVKAGDGTLVPLHSFVTLETEVQPVTLNQFNQQNSVTFQAVPTPGVSLGTALDFLETTAKETLPEGFSYDFSGQSRQYKQEGNALVATFVFALAVIFLVLAAQFESFRDPLVILISVPLSLCGALIPLVVGVATLNIYSQFGLITLIGLIAKHGILICEVAREKQEHEGMNRREAVIEAAALRLRPILMTTAAMVAGLIPLLFASGAGAQSRFSIAIVIVAGMSVGTLFTLFVLPVVYSFIATDHRARAQANEKRDVVPAEGTNT